MSSNEQLFELLAIRATDVMRAEDERALNRLLGAAPDVDPTGFERAAAAVHEALCGPERALPPTLRARLTEVAAQPSDGATSVSRTSGTAAFGWWAAAAALAIAVLGWWPRLAPAPPQGAQPQQQELVATETLREELLTVATTLSLAWSPTEDTAATGARGDVVWNNELQQGFMRFAGLEINDPTVSQYQLWIFDKVRDERYPVDGGVFNMTTANAEVIVPIQAKIRVGEPYLFAVTVEPPGGVVVSDRERIVLVAQPS